MAIVLHGPVLFSGEPVGPTSPRLRVAHLKEFLVVGLGHQGWPASSGIDGPRGGERIPVDMIRTALTRSVVDEPRLGWQGTINVM